MTTTASKEPAGPLSRKNGNNELSAVDGRFLNILKSTPFFYELSAAEFEQIASEIKVHSIVDETAVIREGEPGSSLFFIVSGSMRVTIRLAGRNNNLLLSKIKAGDFFGEYSLLTGRNRSATVVAITEAQLLEIPRPTFEKVALKYKSIRRFLIDLCGQHEKDTAAVLRANKVERRRYPRVKVSGKIKFQEYNRAGAAKVVKISTGTIADLSEGGLRFYVSSEQVGEEIEQMPGKIYTAKLILKEVPSPVKLRGEVISTEVAIVKGDLARYHIVRMKIVDIDKRDKEVFKGLLS